MGCRLRIPFWCGPGVSKSPIQHILAPRNTVENFECQRLGQNFTKLQDILWLDRILKPWSPQSNSSGVKWRQQEWEMGVKKDEKETLFGFWMHASRRVLSPGQGALGDWWNSVWQVSGSNRNGTCWIYRYTVVNSCWDLNLTSSTILSDVRACCRLCAVAKSQYSDRSWKQPGRKLQAFQLWTLHDLNSPYYPSYDPYLCC